MKRRDFIRNATVGLGLAMCTRLPETLFASPYGKPIGLQLYTLRDLLEYQRERVRQRLRFVVVAHRREVMPRRVSG